MNMLYFMGGLISGIVAMVVFYALARWQPTIPDEKPEEKDEVVFLEPPKEELLKSLEGKSLDDVIK